MRTRLAVLNLRNKKKIRTNSIILFVLILLFGATVSVKENMANSSATMVSIVCNTSETETGLYREGTIEMYWENSDEYYIGSSILGIGGIFQVNCTLLAISNTSVLCKVFPDPLVHWSPIPANITLLPGESFEETFTLESSEFQLHNEITYFPTLLTEGSNATLHYWWKVLNKGEIAPVNSFVYTFGILLLFTSINALVLEKQRKKK